MATILALGFLMQQEPVDFDGLWNYQDPAGTEKKFAEVLPKVRDDADRHAQLLTQIARAQGLQRKFDEAHKTLDEVKKLLTAETKVAAIRYLLERGRVFNSSKKPDQARPLFVEALEAATAAGQDFHAVDAAHMVAIVEPPKEAIEWNRKAIAMAKASKDPKARNWLGSLYNNVGWSLHDLGQYEEALGVFEAAQAWREEQKQPEQIRIARWAVGRCLRSLKRYDEALAIQISLNGDLEKLRKKDGYVYEELAECLVLLGRPESAVPFFGKAWDELSKDPWLVENEPARLKRLKELGKR